MGYVGIGYRYVDWRTGKPLKAPLFVGDRDWITNLSSYGLLRVRVPPAFVGYGKPITKVFSVLDSAQFFHTRDLSVVWNEDHILGADAEAMQQIVNLYGEAHPIGNVYRPMVCSNLNQASLTITQNLERSIKETCQFTQPQ